MMIICDMHETVDSWDIISVLILFLFSDSKAIDVTDNQFQFDSERLINTGNETEYTTYETVFVFSQ